MSVDQLADEIAEILGRYYAPGIEMQLSDESDRIRYTQHGDTLEALVAEVLGGVDEDDTVASAIVRRLTYCSHRDRADGGEPRFQSQINYARRALRPVEVEEKWLEFKSGIMHRSRFFNDHGKQFLDWLFRGIHSFRGFSYGDSDVVRILAATDDVTIYRARYCPPSYDYKKIVANPETELAAPPKELAKAGRMNPVGVPVFYGAFDRDTCIAELRPSVGGMVLSGAFKLNLDTYVLDFGMLEDFYETEGLSYFDPNYRINEERRQFLKMLHSKISSAVVPGQEQEYLITQVIAEYLSTQIDPKIDGVLFSSAQHENGQNIVFFSHALSAVPSELTPIRIEYIPGSLEAHSISGVVFTKDPLWIHEGEIMKDENYDFHDEWDY